MGERNARNGGVYIGMGMVGMMGMRMGMGTGMGTVEMMGMMEMNGNGNIYNSNT
jgi:hypothetical protein